MYKTKRLTLILAALIAAPLSAQGGGQQVNPGYAPEFYQQDIVTILYSLAQAGKLNLSVGNYVSGIRASLRITQPLTTKEQFLSAMKGIAEDNALTFTYDSLGGLVRVQGKAPVQTLSPQQQQQMMQLEQERALAEANKQSIHTYQLKHVSAQTLAPTLTALFQQQGGFGGGRIGGTTNFGGNTNFGNTGRGNNNMGRGNTNTGGRGGTNNGGRGNTSTGRGGRGELAAAYDLIDPDYGSAAMVEVPVLDTLWTFDESGVPVISEIRQQRGTMSVSVMGSQGGGGMQGIQIQQANPLQALQNLFGGQGGVTLQPNQIAPPRITAETQSNQLLIMSNDEDWAKIQQILAAIDLRPMQVLIEVTIAEVSRSSDLSVGLNGTLINQRGIVADTFSASSAEIPVRSFIARLVGARGAVDYNVAINALQQRGDVKVLSMPIVIAQNNLQATLNVGQSIPFPTSTQTTVTGGTPSVITTYSQQDVGTILNITPTINRDGYVNMLVSQSDNSAALDPNGTGQLVISKREANTNVFLRDGQTTVIGGLSGKSTNKIRAGIPILSHIPIIGPFLFGSRTESERTSELFLFLTPHILSVDADIDAMKDAVQNNSDLLRDVPVGARLNKPDSLLAGPPDTSAAGGRGGRSFR